MAYFSKLGFFTLENLRAMTSWPVPQYNFVIGSIVAVDYGKGWSKWYCLDFQEVLRKSTNVCPTLHVSLRINTGGTHGQHGRRNEVPKLIELKAAAAAEQKTWSSVWMYSLTQRSKVKKKPLFPKWCDAMGRQTFGLWVLHESLIQNSVPVIFLAQFLLWLLEPKSDLCSPKIRSWMTQGKITVESLWGHTAFCTFPYHLLPPSVKVRRPITRDLWLKSVWPLWFAPSLSPLVSKCHTILVCCSVYRAWICSVGHQDGRRDMFDNLHQRGTIMGCKISRKMLIYMQCASSQALSGCYLSSTENRVFSKYGKCPKHHCMGTAGKTIILAVFLFPLTLLQWGIIWGTPVPSAQLLCSTSASSYLLLAAAWSDSETPEEEAF